MKDSMFVRRLGLGFSACSLCGLAAVARPTVFAANTVPYQIVDKNGSGQVAFIFQVPAGWKIQDTLNWNLNVRSNPMVYTITAINPAGGSWFSYMSGVTFPFGSGVGGTPYGKPAPAKPSDFLQEYFEHANNQFSPRVLKKVDNPTPFPFKPAVPGVKTFAYHSELLGEITLGGHVSQVKLSTDYLGYRQSVGTGYVGNWTANNITVICAPQAILAETARRANEALQSERPTPEFVETYKQVSDMLLERTKRENDQARAARAQQIIANSDQSGGGSGANVRGNRRIDDPDTFNLRMAVKGLQSRIFSRSIGN